MDDYDCDYDEVVILGLQKVQELAAMHFNKYIAFQQIPPIEHLFSNGNKLKDFILSSKVCHTSISNLFL